MRISHREYLKDRAIYMNASESQWKNSDTKKKKREFNVICYTYIFRLWKSE